nr:IS630 family transposase [Bernardetia litoralis]
MRWFNRYEKEGIAGLETTKEEGRRPILRIDNEEEMNKVESLVEASPQSLKVVVSQLEEDLGKSMSVKTLKRLLKKKWCWKCFRKVTVKKPAPVVYEEKKRSLEFLILLFLTGYIYLRFCDESFFNLEPNVPYGWCRIGEQVGIKSSKGGNLNVFGLLNLCGELSSFVSTQNVNSKVIIDCIDQFVETTEKTTVLVLDNVPWHISKEIEEKIEEWEEKGVLIFYLPSYSPHLNPIETLWRKIKIECLRPQDFISKEDLHQAVKNILKKYNSKKYKIDFTIKASCYDNYV